MVSVELAVLGALYSAEENCEPLTIQNISRKVVLDENKVRRVIASLRRKGLVNRNAYSLTPKGRGVVFSEFPEKVWEQRFKTIARQLRQEGKELNYANVVAKAMELGFSREELELWANKLAIELPKKPKLPKDIERV